MDRFLDGLILCMFLFAGLWGILIIADNALERQDRIQQEEITWTGK